jgi:hypothetical protein
MGFQHFLDGSNERSLVVVRIVALLDAFQKVLSIRAVLSPIQDRLVMLIDACVIGANGNAKALERAIKSGLCERVPCAGKNLHPFGIVAVKLSLFLT